MFIEVGQYWRTRNGSVVQITADRQEGHSAWPGVDTWRWALNCGEIANTEGRIALDGRDHPLDLIELIDEEDSI